MNNTKRMCRCRMRQIEITVRLTEKIEEAIAKLEKRGFKRIRESDIHDIYMSNLDEEIKIDKNINDIKNLLKNRDLIDPEVAKYLTTMLPKMFFAVTGKNMND